MTTYLVLSALTSSPISLVAATKASHICQILEKKWEYNEAVHQLFIDFKNAYDSVRREVLYNIFIEFGIRIKLVRLIKMSERNI